MLPQRFQPLDIGVVRFSGVTMAGQHPTVSNFRSKRYRYFRDLYRRNLGWV